MCINVYSTFSMEAIGLIFERVSVPGKGRYRRSEEMKASYFYCVQKLGQRRQINAHDDSISNR